ncbi:hypothetical protein C7H19_09575 [Aphanothece hegewaldii CCALA 016]|uniref:Diguanylate cyclase response regulator n=1 Tax=Aphanothece hegewaldii CCALA 016 TaxID=2107694 RepID=A0A2T1LYH9_9CHRO|nr:diguanylate cyclase [Aphanothece hegewaldii]PSF37414.1 hypothetical protein C7H19_09575 [Aphanothece hegewaldii CCALA 016]
MTIQAEQFSEANILIIGDIPDQLAFFCPLLLKRGYNVYHTKDLNQGIEKATTDLPHLIILSTELKDPDSYTFCQTIKENKIISHISVLFFVIDHLTFDVWKIYKIGGADYLSYPYHPEEMLTRIHHQMTIAKLKRRIDKQNSQLEKTLEDLHKVESNMGEVYNNLREFSFDDTLTKVANRRRFEEILEKEWRRCARDRISWGNVDQTSLSLILGDLDYFHAYNEQVGLQAGDRCLQDIAQAIVAVIKRPADLVARYHGATFAILLPYTNLDGALQVTNLIRLEIEQLKISHPTSKVSQYITLSFGVVTGIPSNALDSDIVTRRASDALQQAKEKGRNCIVCDTI